MGALVTVELPEDSPVLTRPWIITFGPLREEEDWEPVVCGPYERPHALSLAEAVAADDDLIAVVEPLLAYVTVEEIRGEIATSRSAAAEQAESADESGLAEGDAYGDYERDLDDERAEGSAAPSPDEIREGLRRIAARLTGETG